MDTTRFARIERLFLAALDVEPTARPAWLRRACDGDARLHDEVCDWLAADADPAPLLGGRALDAFAPGEADALFEAPLERVGPWRVTGHLGAGGMGTVYRAERDDGAFEQAVALKVVKRGMDTDAVLARFRDERRILGRLDHPGIARILDAGRSADGRPCLVMELVEGESLTAYADARRLDVDARLALLEDACRAVAYAHQNLVVHRDLKPSNLLVEDTPEGPRVKLLDFGIAKLLADDAPTRTQTGQRLFTPAYAAPEQLRGGAVTTATDVYGLGAVLYRVLTDARPIPTAGRSPAEIELAVLQGHVARPSSVVAEAAAQARGTTAARLRRRLAGDLDRIVLKALATDPTDRYPSALELLADLRRHREGLPVEARAGGTLYRARRFAARHRVGLAGAGAALALVALVTAVAFARVGAERDRAAAEAAKAAAVSEFLAGLFASTDPRETGGAEVTARALLDRGAARLAALDDQPDVQAQMLLVTGEAYKSLQLMSEAEPLLERALAIRRDRLGDAHPDVGAAHDALGLLYELQGRFPEARRAFEQALAVYARAPEAPPLARANALHGLAFAQMRLGELDAAEATIREALALKGALYGEAHPEIAYSLNILGDIHTFQERYDDAIVVHRRALRQRRALLGRDHLDVGSSLHNLGAAYRESGRPREAERVYREALGLYRRHYGDANQEVANTLSQLSFALGAQGRDADAEAAYREALAQMERAGLPDHPRVAAFHALRAADLAQNGRYAEATALVRRANQERERSVGQASATWTVREARYLAAQGQRAPVDALLRRALRLCDGAPPACARDVAAARAELGTDRDAPSQVLQTADG